MATVEKPVRKVTGWHVLAIFSGFFGVVIAVNVGLVWKAVSTYPGLEVENSYVANQTFDAERTAQRALGWVLTPAYDSGTEELRLTFTGVDGQRVTVEALEVLVGRTTEAADDSSPAFVLKNGVYVAVARLAKGKWMLAVRARAADGTQFRQRLDLYVTR